MEIINLTRKSLDAIENTAKGNDNFAIKVIRTESVEGKSSILKKT